MKLKFKADVDGRAFRADAGIDYYKQGRYAVSQSPFHVEGAVVFPSGRLCKTWVAWVVFQGEPIGMAETQAEAEAICQKWEDELVASGEI